MFTGIVSCFAPILRAQKRNSVIEIVLPSKLSNIQSGDSVAVDGVCLTVEKVDSSEIVFALAQDTLETTGWNLVNLKNKIVNLEPSLKVGSSLGGHFVTGHVDGMAHVQKIQTNPLQSIPSSQPPSPSSPSPSSLSSSSPSSPRRRGSSLSLGSAVSVGTSTASLLRKQESSKAIETAYVVLKLPVEFKPFLWKKGYLTLNGVSLTVQEILGDSLVRLGLVPKTLKRTNLFQLKEGDQVTFEVCYLTRAVFNQSLHKN